MLMRRSQAGVKRVVAKSSALSAPCRDSRFCFRTIAISSTPSARSAREAESVQECDCYKQ